MDAQLRHRLLTDAVVAAHDHPANVDRAVALGRQQIRRRVIRVYAAAITVWALLVLGLVATHAPLPPTVTSEGAVAPSTSDGIGTTR